MRLPVYKIWFAFLLFFQTASFAQNKYVDSLQNELKRKNLPDSERLELLINIGNSLARDNAQLAKEKYLSVYNFAQKKHDAYYMGMAMSGLGRLNDPNNYDSAMYYYLLADSLYQLNPSQNSKQSRATNKASIAEIQRGQNYFDEAIKTYLETISISEKSNASNKWLVLAILYSNVGSIYSDLHQPKKTLEYDLKALKAFRKQSDPFYIAVGELYVASDYKDFDRLKDAKMHLRKAQKLADEINSEDLFYRLYNSWGAFYQKTKDYNKAVTSYKKALHYAGINRNLFQVMNSNRMLGFIYRDMKRYQESLDHMLPALKQTKKLENKILEAELLKNIAMVQSKMGNSKEAVEYYKDYVQLNDSLNSEETKRRVNEIENKYQSIKKRDSILALQKNYQMQSIQLQQKKTVNIALIAGCVLLLLLALQLYKNFKNKNRLLVQKEKLHQQQIIELEKEKKLLAAQSLMKGQEEERSRLAKDLHDGVGGLLSGVKLSMSTMKGNVFLSEENARSFENVIGQLDQSISELRRVSHNMMPEALIKYGLKEALENYCENLNFSGKINVQLQTYGMENRMEQSTEIVVYRIIQELLNNVIKHAEAKKVLIQLVREDDRFNLTVEDDGKGFDVNEVKNGAGLANIKARIDYLNGNIDVVSKKGEGTSVHIEGNCS
jgi:signal transduction histidine kinase